MSREIRRVPANWQHPTYRTERWRRGVVEVFKPLFDRSFADVASEWDQAKAAFDQGERPDYFVEAVHGSLSFEEWHGERPTPEYYVPYDVKGDLPWWQMYETVTEGTPVTPAFSTADELIEHLATIGEVYDDGEGSGPWPRDRAQRFVMDEKWFPSFIIAGGETFEAKDGYPR